MKTHLRILLLISVAIQGSLLQGQEPAAPAAVDEFRQAEEFLAQTEQSRKQFLHESTAAMQKAITSALANDVTLLDAFKDAYAEVHFDGAKREHNRMREWGEKNKVLFRDRTFLTALRAHVQYVLVTLYKLDGDDEQALRMMREWLGTYSTGLARHDLLNGGMAASPFFCGRAQAGMLNGLKNWYMGDLGNLIEIHRVNVIGLLRDKKDPRIFEEWQVNVRMEQEAAERQELSSQREKFYLNRRPWLIWQCAKDQAALGQRKQAVSLLVEALKASPRCADYEAISAEIRKMIADAKASPVPQ